MPAPSVTYSFSNGTAADATQVNQNFTDIINGLSDGTKDFTVAALITNGNVTFNANLTVGNSSSDDLTINASLASSIPIKTNASFNFGDATHGLAGFYLGNSTFTTKLATAATASWTFTFPTTAGTPGRALFNTGSGATDWKFAGDVVTKTSTNYQITDTDGIRTVLASTGADDRNIYLPDPATNPNRIITLKKIDSGAGWARLMANEDAGGFIDSNGFYILDARYETVTVQSDGTEWHVLCKYP